MTQYIWYAVGIIILLLAAFLGVSRVQINRLEVKVSEGHTREAVELAKVNEQAALIAKYLKTGEEQAARLKAAEAQAAQDRAKAEARIAKLAAQKIPEAPEARVEYVLDAFKELSKEWEGQHD
jgi:hypothetical protein